MSLLYDKLTDWLAGWEKREAWPPAQVKDHWEEIEQYRRRYRNIRQEMIQANPNLAVSQSKTEVYVPIPWPRELCRFSAQLLFAETPRVTRSESEEAIRDLTRVNDLGAFAIKGGVRAACDGRIGIRVIRDPDVDKNVPLLVLVHENQIIWDHRHGEFYIGGMVVIERHPNPDKPAETWRLLEEHLPGFVRRTLFKGEKGKLGKKMSLSAIPEFAQLRPLEQTGLDKATLVPWENVPGAESDMFGLGPLFDEANEAESLLLDRARKTIPRAFVDSSLADSTGRLNIDGYIMTGASRMRAPLGSTPGDLIKVVEPAFNAGEHVRWNDHINQLLVTLAGYSPLTWNIQGQTANVTRAVSGYAMKLAQLRTLLTRQAKAHMALQALGLSHAIALAMMEEKGEVMSMLPSIELGDGMPNDALDGAQEVLFLRQALAASTETLVKTVHPTWTDQEVETEVARIVDSGLFPQGMSQGLGPLTPRVRALLDSADDDLAGDGVDSGEPAMQG